MNVVNIFLRSDRISLIGLGWGEEEGLCRAMATVLWRRALSTAADGAATAVKNGGGNRHKKKNLFDVAKLLPNWGVGRKVAKSHWNPQTFYEITDIKLKKDAGHGVAWGVYHEAGEQAGKVQRIGGANKRCWKYIEEEVAQPWQTV